MFGKALYIVLSVFVLTEASSLESYNADPNDVSVSGISSGAAMATQFHVIHSSAIMGAGIIAGIPFHASGGNLNGALSSMSMPSYNVGSLVTKTTEMASKGQIDDTRNMQNDRVYVFAGTRDTVVSPDNGHKLQQYYQEYTSYIKTKFDLAAQHCMPTENYGVKCSQLSSTDFMNKCQYNAAYELLNYIYGGNLQRPTTSTSANGKLLTFDQSEFLGTTGGSSTGSSNGGLVNNNLLSGLTGSNPLTSLFSGTSSATSNLMSSYTNLLKTYTNMLNGMVNSTSQLMKPLLGKRKRLLFTDYLKGLSKLPGMSSLPGLSGSTGTGSLGSLSSLTGLGGSSSSMDNIGYIYIPSGCMDKQSKCKLHIALHGCKMGRQKIQDSYAVHAGYNEVAELNNIIILYPQAVTSMMNPNGCWDWWGYTGANFESKDGVQIKAIKAMMDRVIGSN